MMKGGVKHFMTESSSRARLKALQGMGSLPGEYGRSVCCVGLQAWGPSLLSTLPLSCARLGCAALCWKRASSRGFLNAFAAACSSAGAVAAGRLAVGLLNVGRFGALL